jgi:succinate dehydrogenase / fumarate reductase cytochrome b subunit
MSFIRNFWRSTIGKKTVMAVTGLIGVGFVVGHMLGNLQMFKGAEAMNDYAQLLKSLGGLLLLIFIVFHILHFTTLTIFPDYSRTDVYGNVVKGFRNPLVSAFYVLAMVFLGLHLYHGAWSSLRTIGAVTPSANPLRRYGAAVVAVVVWAGFTAIPLAVLAGIIEPNTPRSADPAGIETAAVAPRSATAPARTGQ